MDNDRIVREIKRLKFEDFLWIIFIGLAIANIYGDHEEIDYLKTNDRYYKKKSTKTFVIILFITLLIYSYFWIRDYYAHKEVSSKKKRLYSIKLLGISLLISGVLCLLYFQINQTSFTGSPA